jgi:hypothetical protein
MNGFKTFAKGALLGSLCLSLGACSAIGNQLNPFADPPTEEALMGEPNDHALSGQAEKIDTARAALNHMSTYERAHYPKPNNPVMRPAVVRLMWIPDHVNSHGDLVPAHYYYLKVKSTDWAVKDAFELEAQNNKGSSRSSNIPYVVD